MSALIRFFIITASVGLISLSATAGAERPLELMPNQSRQVGPNQADDLPYLLESGSMPAANGSRPVNSAKNELQLSVVGSTLWNWMNDVVLYGDYAVCAMSSGVIILDITDPLSPELVSEVYLGTETNRYLAISGSHVYTSDYSGMQIINIADPAAPFLEGECDLDPYSGQLVVGDTLVYLTRGNSGLYVVNCVDPEDPFFVGSCDTPGQTRGLDIKDTLVFVADYPHGMLVINVVDPENPTNVGEYESDGFAYDVAVQGNFAYLADYDSLQIINITYPDNPVHEGTCEGTWHCWKIEVVDTLAYLTGYHYGSEPRFYIVNVADPQMSQLLVTYDDLNRPSGLAVSDTLVYIADCLFGMRVMDVSDPYYPVQAGSYFTAFYANDVALAGDYAYVTCYSYYQGTGNLMIIDIADVHNPCIVSNFETPGYGSAIALVDTLAYVVGHNNLNDTGGLVVVSVADPEAPYQVGRLDFDDYALDVSVQGDYAYIGSQELLIVNISNPASPFVDSTYSHYTNTIIVNGDYAYVNSLQVLDITDPLAPLEVGDSYQYGFASDLKLRGNTIYTSSYCSELMIGVFGIVNIEDPENPYHLSATTTMSEAICVDVWGDYAFVSQYGNLDIFNINDPENPYSAGTFFLEANKMAVRDNYIFGVGWNGFLILEIGYICGDINNSGAIDLLDITYLINYLYRGGPPPDSMEASDVNVSGVVDILDITFLLNYIYKGGPNPDCM